MRRIFLFSDGQENRDKNDFYRQFHLQLDILFFGTINFPPYYSRYLPQCFFADMRNNIRQILHQTWSAFHAKKWIHTGCCVKAMNLNCKCAFKADYHNWKTQQQYGIILLNSFSFSLSYQSSGKHHDCRFYFGGIRPRQDKKN